LVKPLAVQSDVCSHSMGMPVTAPAVHAPPKLVHVSGAKVPVPVAPPRQHSGVALVELQTREAPASS
jgi:hypothetical protein